MLGDVGGAWRGGDCSSRGIGKNGRGLRALCAAVSAALPRGRAGPPQGDLALGLAEGRGGLRVPAAQPLCSATSCRFDVMSRHSAVDHCHVAIDSGVTTYQLW